MISSLKEKIENDFIKSENERINESYKYFCENIDKEELKDINTILIELNKAIKINFDYYENDNNNECMELIFLLEKKEHKKNRNVNKKIKNGSFKSLKKPKIISMNGRVLSNNSSNETQYSPHQSIKE